jgi:hypothetical protein
LKKTNERLTKNMVQLNSEVAETRARVAILRELAPAKLAKLMSYTDEQIAATQVPTKKWNAINAVMSIEQIEYKSAVQTLQVATGGSEAVYEMAGEYAKAQETEAAPTEEQIITPAPQLSTMQKKQKAEAEKQLTAIGAEQYRVTLMSKVKPTINLGKDKDPNKTERFYSKKEILEELMPTLGFNNARGYNIFITPMPTETTDYLLVDDIKNLTEVQKMQPAVILQSSPVSTQALIKMKNVGLTHEQLNRWFRETNKKIGDPNISAIVHPMRLAGFTNRKPEYQKTNSTYPFVRVLEAKGTAWEQAVQAAREIIGMWEEEGRFKQKLAQVKAANIANSNARKAMQSEGQANAYAIKYYEKAIKNGYDLSASDYSLAKKLLEAGATEENVVATIVNHSPGLEERHSDLETYISKTIEKAKEKVAKPNL